MYVFIKFSWGSAYYRQGKKSVESKSWEVNTSLSLAYLMCLDTYVYD